MGLALFKERRISARRKLTGLLPGRLVKTDTGDQIQCRPVDVSRTGMGIISDKEMEPGSLARLDVGGRSVELQITWGQPDFGKQDQFRYGLVTLDPEDDLEAEFVRAKCLR